MICEHLWLPNHGTLWRNVFCGRCGETRRVRSRWLLPGPRTIADALGEAIDRRVIPNDEVAWGGQRLR